MTSQGSNPSAAEVETALKDGPEAFTKGLLQSGLIKAKLDDKGQPVVDAAGKPAYIDRAGADYVPPSADIPQATVIVGPSAGGSGTSQAQYEEGLAQVLELGGANRDAVLAAQIVNGEIELSEAQVQKAKLMLAGKKRDPEWARKITSGDTEATATLQLLCAVTNATPTKKVAP